MEQSEGPAFPIHLRGFLLIAAIYNLAWGFFIYNFPEVFYQWVSGDGAVPLTTLSVQGLGVLLFGGVYAVTAFHPYRYWFLIAAGAVSKLVGAIGFYFLVMNADTTRTFYFHLIMNDLIWVPPLTYIAIKARQVRQWMVHNAEEEE